MVPNLEPGVSGSTAAHGDLDAGAFGGVIYGVAHQVGDNLAQLGFVTLDGGWLEVSREGDQSHLAGRVEGTGVLDCIGGKHGEVDRPSFQGPLPV